ncbi:hypothetical protein FH972_001086 [Carpinus fangiana]|uniref:RNase H type-1 domain-containing protein n=1 Tax=Carpinus fangiana TaxID=176857 RepID=A0A5N6QB01_9ROSI|nr:hypothetical protein FH972_001086 [Carpinus fangiana]
MVTSSTMAWAAWPSSMLSSADMCHFARIVWSSSSWPINTEAFNNQPITEWTVTILNPNKVLNVPRVGSGKFQPHAAITLDHIWFVRNQLVHNEVQPLIPQFIQKISSTIRAHTLAWEDATSHSLWSLPLLGSFKANFDVAVRADLAVVTVVISEHADDIIYAATKRIFTQDAAVGEALAALLATHAASLYGVYNLILEGDAINIILTIQNPTNFDVAVRADLAVVTVVISEHADDIIYAATKRIFTQDAAVGEALAALLATHAASLYGVYNLILEGDAINIILTNQNPSLFMD